MGSGLGETKIGNVLYRFALFFTIDITDEFNIPKNFYDLGWILMIITEINLKS